MPSLAESARAWLELNGSCRLLTHLSLVLKSADY